MSHQIIGVADSSANRLASEALVRCDRIVFTEPSEADRGRRRWGRADVLVAGPTDALVDRREGVAVVSVDPAGFDALFEHVPDPVVLVLAPAGTRLPSSQRFHLVPRYTGCCYSISIADKVVRITELSRPPAAEPPAEPVVEEPRRRRPRRERRRRTEAEPIQLEASEGEEG